MTFKKVKQWGFTFVNCTQSTHKKFNNSSKQTITNLLSAKQKCTNCNFIPKRKGKLNYFYLCFFSLDLCSLRNS